MKSPSRVLAIAVFTVFGLSPAGAQDPGQALTLSGAVKLALERNPDVLIAAEQLEELRGKIQEVRADAYPQVSLQGFGLRLRDPSFLNSASFDNVPPEFRDALVPRSANLFDFGLSVKQPVYTAGKVGNAIRLAEAGMKEKEEALEAAKRQVAFKVFQAYNDLLLAQANFALVRETIGQRQKHLELARNRFAQGVATEIDVLRSQVNLANLEPDRIRAENRVRFCQAALNNLIVADIEAPTSLADKLEYHVWAVPPVGEIQAEALEVRPEVLVARRQVEEARLLHKLALSDNKLSVDMEGRWGYSVRDPSNLFKQDFARWNITFNFKLPFYDGGRKAGKVVQASSQIRASLHALARLENDVRLQIKSAHNDLLSSAQAIEAARLNVIQAEKVLSMMQANYQYGAATTLDVVDSEAALTVARNAQINATYEYEMAKARLRLAAGKPILDGEETP